MLILLDSASFSPTPGFSEKETLDRANQLPLEELGSF